MILKLLLFLILVGGFYLYYICTIAFKHLIQELPLSQDTRDQLAVSAFFFAITAGFLGLFGGLFAVVFAYW